VNEKTIATIALHGERHSSFKETMEEAAKWLEIAAAQGAQLAVLPETINLLHRKTGSAPFETFALEYWQEDAAFLCDAAVRANISLVLPLLVRENGILANRFYLLSREGTFLGYYQKRIPAPGEQALGVEAGNTSPLLWEGLRLGGAICVDVYFPSVVFDPQVDAGADLFVIPSYTPAGAVLDTCALIYGVPFVLAYSPWSRILDRDGTELAAGGYRSETLRAGFGSPIQMATINFNAVTLFADLNQDKMRDVERHYGGKVRIRFNQDNCIFTLESRCAELSIDEVMRQFGLISRRNYFANYYPGLRDRAKTR